MFRQRTSLSIILSTGLLSAGCHQTNTNVYVDVSAAVMAGSTFEAPAATGLPPSPGVSARYNLPSMPAVTVEHVGDVGAAKVQASIAANRERTFKLIVRRLHDAYSREAANLRAQKVAEFTPVRAQLIANALDAISKAYNTYANEVGPKIARLAVNAGFPDPDPKGRRKPNGLEGLDTLAYQTSQKMRADIATLKDNFKRYSEATLRTADTDADAKLTDLLSEVARQVGDVDARAQEVARSEVSHAQAQLGTLLADQPPTMLPATPASSVVVSSGATSAIAPPPGGRQGPLASDDLSRAKEDLEIWLAVNKFTLRPKGKARDATAEFIEWRHRFRQAPSTSR